MQGAIPLQRQSEIDGCNDSLVPNAGKSEADAVDVHAVTLFLFAQLYIRQVQRPEAMEVWPSASDRANTPSGAEAAAAFGGSPSSSAHSPLEALVTPASPARSNSPSSNSSQGSNRQHLHQGGEFAMSIFRILGHELPTRRSSLQQ